MHMRPERPGDAPAIHSLTDLAFRDMPHAEGDEADLVDALRAAGALTISLVAIAEDGTIIGHVAFSPIQMTGQTGSWFALGPVSVDPERQMRGIGTALIWEGLARLRELGASGCILTGEPDYYRRFGFAASEHLTCYRQASPYLQGLAFYGRPVTGDVRFHAAFGTAV